ncbi:chromosomal replication initiator protein DnaA [Fervidobacterium thailandense]|uniref:Chromosomal replication initiator protein DnaA n=1 Tax=Fervidobacterium thailandense TaxID=1008305 RepID=A0A1E3G2K3_9BACT|nr:chromosomal replication initiator protein DnaA [Fervidobacterium thailandense]
MKDKILSLLREKVSRQQWEHWFIDFSVKRIEGTHVIFEVGNLFIKGYLEKKFDKIIRKAVSEVLGQGATYEIVYAEILQNDMTVHDNNQALVKKRPVLITPLNPKYTFDNFVVDEFNQFAYNLLLEAAKKPGTYNPIFIYSEAGMGKTHLVQAFGNYLLTENPDLRFAYLTSEQFMNELINKIKSGTVEEFREKYRRKIDVLVIDDIQFLAGKKGIQIELFHTFNALYESGKQIIVCSDRPPKELKDFQERVISRFQMGVIAQIKTPSKEALKKIAFKVVEDEKVKIPPEIINFIATHIKGSIRVLKGAIVKVIAYKSMYDYVDLEIVKNLLRDNLEMENHNHAPDVIELIAKQFGVSKEDLLSSKKDRKTSLARQISMYVLNKKYELSVRKIAEMFGKTHPAVVSAIKNVEEMIKTDKFLANLVRLAFESSDQHAGKLMS